MQKSDTLYGTRRPSVNTTPTYDNRRHPMVPAQNSARHTTQEAPIPQFSATYSTRRTLTTQRERRYTVSYPERVYEATPGRGSLYQSDRINRTTALRAVHAEPARTYTKRTQDDKWIISRMTDQSGACIYHEGLHGFGLDTCFATYTYRGEIGAGIPNIERSCRDARLLLF